MRGMDSSAQHSGLTAGVLAFSLWGFLALFWKLLEALPALEILSYRIVFSFIVLPPALLCWGRWHEVREAMSNRGALLRLLCSALLIAVNWFTYIWAVTNGHVLDTSLGYYINPLLSVLVGCLFLKERPSRLQGAALVLACIGVLWSVVSQGQFPWIALILAVPFTLYSFIRKTVAVEALPGLFVETALLAPVVLGWLVWQAMHGEGVILDPSFYSFGLLFLSGPLTSLPLVLFAYAARHMRMMTLGIVQYLSPTCTFLLGVLVFKETLSPSTLVMFVCIWTAIALYTWESWRLVRGCSR